MKRFEDMEQEEKEQLIKEYYSWLLDVPKEEIELEREIEYSFAGMYQDPYIYYPKLIGDLYRTDAMQKMGRITQLGTEIIGDGVSKQNRLDHCKHTAYLRLEESIYLLQEGKLYNNIVEANNLKIYLLAEEVKAALHDIGHSPFSHQVESVLNKLVDKIEIEYDEQYKNAEDFIPLEIEGDEERNLKISHEDIGKMYIEHDEQINEILSRVQGLKEALYTVMEEDVFSNRQHNEGNFDTDRKSYMLRDALYYGKPKNYIYPMYNRLFFKKGTDSQITDQEDATLDLNSIDIIDVYDDKDFEKVFKFLIERRDAYKERYFSPLRQVVETYIGFFLEKVYYSKDTTTLEITKFVDMYFKLIKYKGLRQEDYEFFKSFDEIKMYSEIINIAQNAKEESLKTYATMMIPKIEVFMDMVAEMIKNTTFTKQGELNKKRIRHQIQDILESSENDIFKKNIESKDFFRKNVIIVENLEEVPEEYRNHFRYSQKRIRIYDKSQPLYFHDVDGKIVPLDKHSRCQEVLSSYNIKLEDLYEKEVIDVYYCIIPELLSKGYTWDDINKLKTSVREYEFEHKPEISMKRHKTPERKRQLDGSIKVNDPLKDFYTKRAVGGER